MKLIGRTGRVAGHDMTIGGAMRIGAAEDNDFRIGVSGVSRHHARIVKEGDSYFLEDAGSTNGTFLNGQRVSARERLRHLDVITLGRDVDLVTVATDPSTPPPSMTKAVEDAWLEPIEAQAGGPRVDIPPGELTLGRVAPSNVLLDSPLVSQLHARIERTNDHVIVSDLGSVNGTFVNGEAIKESTELMDGDTLVIAGTRHFRVHVAGNPSKRTRSQEVVAAQTAIFDSGWKTRLVWSADELAELEAERKRILASVRNEAAPPAAGTGAKPAAPPAKAAAKPAAPPAAAAPAAAPPAAPAAAKPPVAAKPAAPAAPPVPTVPAAPAATKPAPPAPPPAAPAAAPPVVPAAPPAATKPVPAAAPATTKPAVAPAPPAAAPPPPAPPATAPPAAPPVKAEPPAPPVAPPAPKPQPPAPPRPPAPAPVEAKAPVPAPVAPPKPPPPAPVPAADAVTVISTPGIRGVKLTGPKGTFQLPNGRHIVGRAEGVGMPILDPQVSRAHAAITVDATDVRIEDTGSANGTSVNGVKVGAGGVSLKNGDKIAFGKVEFNVELMS